MPTPGSSTWPACAWPASAAARAPTARPRRTPAAPTPPAPPPAATPPASAPPPAPTLGLGRGRARQPPPGLCGGAGPPLAWRGGRGGGTPPTGRETFVAPVSRGRASARRFRPTPGRARGGWERLALAQRRGEPIP